MVVRSRTPKTNRTGNRCLVTVAQEYGWTESRLEPISGRKRPGPFIWLAVCAYHLGMHILHLGTLRDVIANVLVDYLQSRDLHRHTWYVCLYDRDVFLLPV